MQKNNKLARIKQINYNYQKQEKTNIVNCNLCHSNNFTIITHVDRYGYNAKATACNNCGLVFLNPVMNSNSYHEFYSNVYRPLVSAYHNRVIDSQTIQAEQREYARTLIDFISPVFKANSGSILDIGGSTGIVAKTIGEKFNMDITVLDPAADELIHAKNLNMEIVPGFIEDYNPNGKKFDLILLCQTIDHLSDALGTLKKIHKLLNMGGVFFVDIVDFRAAYLRNNKIEEAIKIDHPYYFTEETIELMLNIAGFSIIKKNYASDQLHVGYMCSKSKELVKQNIDKSYVRSFFREIRKIANHHDR